MPVLQARYNEALWAESAAGGSQTVPPGAGGVVNGAPRDLGGHATPDTVRAVVIANQAGTLAIQQSTDGVNWATVSGATQATTANQATTVQAAIILEFYRAVFTNGATPCTSFQMWSCTVQ